MPNNADLVRPDGLSPEGNKAYDVIMTFLEERGLLHTGGCKVFYSPVEWMERGEEYGGSSHLIIVYDGGAHAKAFSLDHAYPTYEHYEALCERLESAGLFAEECTHWYSAVYSTFD